MRWFVAIPAIVLTFFVATAGESQPVKVDARPVHTVAMSLLATSIARTEVSVWQCQDHLGKSRSPVSVPPWSLPRSHAYRAWVLNLWTVRHKACVMALAEVKRQWNWQAWLPDKWQRIGACETGYGQRPGNWHHANSRFVSAFGISRQAYDQDAAAMGAPAWNDVKHPTPWQQYQAALGHARLHGGLSGWGCRGA